MFRVIRYLAAFSILTGSAVILAREAGAQQSPPLWKSDGSPDRPKTVDFMENGGAGKMGDVKSRIKDQIDEGKATLYTDQFSKVETFVKQAQEGAIAGKADPMKKIDRGYDTPTDFHALDKQLIDEHLDSCWDGLDLINAPCYCVNWVTLPDGTIIPGMPTIENETEYWYPVSKVENVPTPLETGYLTKQEIEQNVYPTLENTYLKGNPPAVASWVDFAANRMINNSKSYIEGNFGSVLTINSAPSVDTITDAYYKGLYEKAQTNIDEISQKITSDQTGQQQQKDAHLRSMYPENSSYMQNEWHVMPEPYGRNDLYWNSRISKLVCHWNLDYGGYDSTGADLNVALNAMYFSDIPDFQGTMKVSGRSVSVKSFEAGRNAPQLNLQLGGKSTVRPGVQYDHADLYGPYDDAKAFLDNGGYISMYMTQANGRDQNPMYCPESYMDTEFFYITHDKGRTPNDALKSLWSKRESTNEDFQKTGGFLSSGCLRKNLGEWVPTRNLAQTIYHSQAAMVGTMRGLKLAYYYFGSSQYDPGQILSDEAKQKCPAPLDINAPEYRLGDSYGIEPCYWAYVIAGRKLGGEPDEIEGVIPDGMYYDFEPNIYTWAGWVHQPTTTTDKDVYWILNCSGGTCAFAADKVQWTTSKGMPKKCIGLQKYFNEIEKTYPGEDLSSKAGGPAAEQGGKQWKADMPNLIELPRDDPKESDPHNTAIQWRLLRSCPKDLLNGQFIKIVGTNTAVCCLKCPCPGVPGCPTNCVIEKKL